MSEYLFRVVLEGTIKEGYEISVTQGNLAKLFKVPVGKVTDLLCAKPIVIKRNVNSITAKKIKHAIEKTGACCRIEATTQSNQQVNQVGANQTNIVQGVNQEAMSDTTTSSTKSQDSIDNSPIQSVSDGTTIKLGFEKKEKSRKDSIAEKARRVAEKASSIAADASHNISKRTSVTLNKSKIVASDFANSTTKGGQKAWKWTKDTGESIALQSKVKFKDDVNLIRQECALLNNLTTTKSSPALFQSLLYASAGMGLLSNEIELARLSRSIMDVDSAPQQKLIEMMFGEAQVMEISKWMDSVPAFDVIGGGVTHRIQHGHDIDAFIELAQNHNMAGVSEWLNHVVLRDFWTPSGIPYLPTGSDSIYHWLIDKGVGKAIAANLLSINAWEFLGLFMLYRSSKKMLKFIRVQIDNRKVRKFFDRGQERDNYGDFSKANVYYEKVLRYSMENPVINWGFAMKFFHKGQQSPQNESTIEHFRRCLYIADGARLKLTEDQTVPYQGGIEISLSGLLTTLMASSWVSSQEGSKEYIKGVITSGVKDLIKMANKLKDRLLARPFSGIANEVLALKLLMSAPFDIPTNQTPLTIRESIFNTLEELAKEEGDIGDYAKTLMRGIERQYPLVKTAKS